MKKKCIAIWLNLYHLLNKYKQIQGIPQHVNLFIQTHFTSIVDKVNDILLSQDLQLLQGLLSNSKLNITKIKDINAALGSIAGILTPQDGGRRTRRTKFRSKKRKYSKRRRMTRRRMTRKTIGGQPRKLITYAILMAVIITVMVLQDENMDTLTQITCIAILVVLYSRFAYIFSTPMHVNVNQVQPNPAAGHDEEKDENIVGRLPLPRPLHVRIGNFILTFF